MRDVMALINDQRPFIVIFLQPLTAGGHKTTSLAVFDAGEVSPRRQLN